MYAPTLDNRACSCWYLAALSSLPLPEDSARSSALSAVKTSTLYSV